MAVIRQSSATVTTVFTHFLILIIVAVLNFSLAGNALAINLGYGVALVTLSVLSMILGITAQSPDDIVLRSLLMTISVLWSSLGVYHVLQFFAAVNASESETLFVGYGAFLLVFLLFTFGALYHKDTYSATISLGMFLSCIFEIAALWRPVRVAAAAYYLLLAAIVIYFVLSKFLSRFRHGESRRKLEGKDSRDYIPLGHAMNTIASAVFAGQVLGIYASADRGFVWILTAGCYQVFVAVVAVRRSDVYNGVYFLFHGLFWATQGFNAVVVFATAQTLPFLTASTVIYFIVFALIGIISLTREFVQIVQCVVLCIFCVSVLEDGFSGIFLGTLGWIYFVVSLYTLAAHVSRMKDSSFKLPLGARLIPANKLLKSFSSVCKCFGARTKSDATAKSSNSLFSIDFTLGYSRYTGFEVAGFAVNAVAAVVIVWIPQGVWVLPWALLLGGLSNMAIGSVCFSKGLSFESCAFYVFGSFWLIWGPARGFGTLALDNSAAIITGCVGFLAVGVLLMGLSTVINKGWTVVTFLFNLVIVGQVLNGLDANGSFTYERVINVLFAVACMYCFVATALKSVWGFVVLPLGKPFIQVSFLHSQGHQAFWADGRKANGVRAIADIMNKGGICGIPTDVVYVLVAALKFPKAVERAYHTKKLAEDRPMSMWISKVEQVEEGRPLFGELLWGLMNEIWPSTVSLVVPKGDWYTNLGVGDSGKFVGRPDSIAVRMPDNTVTSHLIDQTGPVATSSANPTGEADTTHHLQVLAKLGLPNVDGILCSGPSPENMASTVVDCRKLHEGKIGFFRIGVVPRSHVEAALAKVKSCHRGSVHRSLSSVSHGGPHENEAFVDDEMVMVDPSNRKNGKAASNETVRNSVSSATTSFTDTSSDGDDTGLIREPSKRHSNSHNIHQPKLNGTSTNSNSNGKHYHSSRVANGNATDYEASKMFTAVSMNGQLEQNSSSSPYEPMQAVFRRNGLEMLQSRNEIGGLNGHRKPSMTENPVFGENTGMYTKFDD